VKKEEEDGWWRRRKDLVRKIDFHQIWVLIS
jgi:hypothetical protein